MPAAPLVARRRYLIVVPGPLPAAPRRSFSAHQGRQRRGFAAAREEQLGRHATGRLYLSRRCTWPVASRRAHHCRRMFELFSSYTACACGAKPRHGPPGALSAALPGANRTTLQAVNVINRHKREINDFACGKKNSVCASSGPAVSRRVAACLRRWRALPLRGPPRGQRKHSLRWLFQIRLSCSRGKAGRHHAVRSTIFIFSPGAFSAESPLGKRLFYCASAY